MFKKLLVTFLGILLVVGFLGGIKGMQIGALIAASKEAKQPPTAVATVKSEIQQWRPSTSSIGTVTPVQGVTLSMESSGLVASIKFESGAVVKEGDLLVQLDTTSEQAELRAAEASADLARINLDRSKELRAKNTISQSELDASVSQAKEADAKVDNIKAVIAKKTLRAPFSGRLGLRQVNLGQFLNAGTPIVTLQSLDPIYVDFYLPQQDLAWVKTGLDVEVVSDARPGDKLAGKVTALAAEIDPSSRNIKIQATLPNTDGALRPGMFVNVSVLQNDNRSVLVVPATAIMYASYGNSVYVVEKNPDGEGLIANQKFVRVGEARGDFVEIVNGIEAGEDVVSAGAFKLRPGADVILENDRTPEAKLNPQPSDT